MKPVISRLAVAGTLMAFLPGVASAITRDIADLQPIRLTFNRSLVNQLSHDTYRDPFDELQTRSYNLLFTNIGRHSNLSPWQGQEGSHTRYLNALIGNNGASNVDNGADAIQGSYIQRQTDALAWGVSAAFLTGNDGSSDSSGATTFTDVDDLQSVDLHGGVAVQVSERSVVGGGVRVIQARSEITEGDFEPGVGGFNGEETFEQLGVFFDAGLRRFLNETSSWEIQGLAGFGTFEQNELSEDLDGSGAVTDSLVIRNYDVTELSLGVYGGYNRLRSRHLGETEFRGGLEHSRREFDNSDLSYGSGPGASSLTLLGQDPIAMTQLHLSAKTIFQAGQTELFTGGQLGYGMVQGSTQVDAAGTVVNEEIDDSQIHVGGTLGLRQPLFQDKLRLIVSGRADVVDLESSTTFDSGSDSDDSTQTIVQYAVGLEGVLANVTIDIAWLFSEQAPVVPVDLGFPSGSRRVVELNRLLVSAAVSW